MPFIAIAVAYCVGKVYDFFIARIVQLAIKKHTSSDGVLDLIGDVAERVARRSDNEVDDKFVINLRYALEGKKVSFKEE